MGCPPVRGDNPRALASVLSYVQVDKHGITIYTTNISVDLAHHEIFHAKGGIKHFNIIKYMYFSKDSELKVTLLLVNIIENTERQ